ncbi:protein Mpv17 isoform X2 [Zophobas morio]|uniref:protein Mpv17 isoform X2 n=1 Tax=Zophobas morio TaxID=2755281 RepID=UPI0030834F2D
MHWIFKAYRSALHRHPVIVQAIQTGILVSAGDAISQVVVEKKNLKTANYKRTVQYFCVGAIYLGPVLTVWYKVLHKYVGAEGKWDTHSKKLKKK